MITNTKKKKNRWIKLAENEDEKEKFRIFKYVLKNEETNGYQK